MFPPGHQAAEPEIARQLGMSRTPVHEAIIRLQEEGLVQVLPRRGVLICPISADDIREIYDVLIAVEGMAAALLAGLPGEARGLPRRMPWSRRQRGWSRRSSAELLDWAAADECFHRAPDRTLRQPAAGPHRRHCARPVPSRPAVHAAPAAAAGSLGGRAPPDHRGNPCRRRCRGRGRARAHRARARDALLPLLAQYGMRNL